MQPGITQAIYYIQASHDTAIQQPLRTDASDNNQ